MEKTYEGIINLALTLVNSMREEKEQEKKHLKNARCKKPSFGNCNYALGRLAAREGLEPPSYEEVEKLVRKYW